MERSFNLFFRLIIAQTMNTTKNQWTLNERLFRDDSKAGQFSAEIWSVSVGQQSARGVPF